MSHSAQPRYRSWVAVFAAYLLVLQAIFAGFAAGSYANAHSLDLTLALTQCAPSGDATPGGDHDTPQAHGAMSCCTAACHMPVAMPPAQPAFEILSHRAVDRAAFVRKLDQPVGYLSDHSPGSPRAPPALA